MMGEIDRELLTTTMREVAVGVTVLSEIGRNRRGSHQSEQVRKASANARRKWMSEERSGRAK